MADIALVTANEVSIVESIVQLTAPAGEAITPGAPVRFDTSTGRFMNGNATSAAEANLYGIATGRKAIPAGWPVTAIRIGVLDGFDLSGMDYGEAVHLSNTDARIADAAGTVAQIVGCVVPGTATTLGTAYDKLLYVQIIPAEAYVDTTE